MDTNKQLQGSLKYKKILNLIPDEFDSIIIDAYEFALEILGDQMRNSKYSQVEHSVNVAYYLAQIGIDINTVIAGLVHQTVRTYDKNKYSINEIFLKIEQKFGNDVLDLVKGNNEIIVISNSISVSEAVHKYILKRKTDLRYLMIRLCDMRDTVDNIEYFDEDFQKDIAKKAISVYAPLAEFINFYFFKKHFEDVGFRILYPEIYSEINMFLRSKQLDNDKLIYEISTKLKVLLRDIHYKPFIVGRIKAPYSIYKKTIKYINESKKPDISAMRDLIAFSIIVKDVKDCYKVASIIEANTVNNIIDFEDYIMDPKPNGFSQLQLIVSIPEITPLKFEIQIMTYEMYNTNTYGYASHFSYKIRGKRYAEAGEDFMWVKEIREKIDKNTKQKKLKLSNPIISNVFSDRVYVFTPQSDIIALAQGSTALDFAFYIHEKIGLRAVNAEINGVVKPLNTKLKNNDIIKINVSPNPNTVATVNSDWLNFVVSVRAKQKIAKYLSKC
ncbi:MAG TPA: HD domain-containing protein [Candidatus Dojkabacteria bacterium]|nr:HD domain-containing protein [Candidatus Dojkabacteria bacterium]